MNRKNTANNYTRCSGPLHPHGHTALAEPSEPTETPALSGRFATALQVDAPAPNPASEGALTLEIEFQATCPDLNAGYWLRRLLGEYSTVTESEAGVALFLGAER